MTLPQFLDSSVAASADRVLTVYLDTNQGDSKNLNRSFETELASKLKEVAQTITTDTDRQAFAAASALVQQFVTGYKPTGRSLAVFATPSGILQSRGLHVGLETEVRWGRPHVKPYLEALDEFERYILVVTDKWHARLLSVFLGKVEASVDVRDDPHTTHIQTAGMDHLESQTGFQRHADENTRKHIRHVIDELETMLQSHPSNRVIVGGNVEAVAEFFGLLPKNLRSNVVGTVALSMIDSIDHLLKTALQVELKAERDFELKAVERLQVAAGKKNKASTGVHDTLQALREGRILSLYYADGLTVSGKECTSCSALFPDDAGDTCGYCAKELKGTDDLLDSMLLKAIETGARIEQVRGAAADKLRETGSIGALLRY